MLFSDIIVSFFFHYIFFIVFIFFFFFFFNDTATTEIYTLSLHDAFRSSGPEQSRTCRCWSCRVHPGDRKSTRLNSSHLGISYAVFCLKKKKNKFNFSYEKKKNKKKTKKKRKHKTK